MMKGYDAFFERPGEVQVRTCQVCATECLVERDKVGPTSFASAVASRHARHDFFRCPNADESWHEQALRLVRAIEETPSKRVASLMKDDLRDLLREQGIPLGVE